MTSRLTAHLVALAVIAAASFSVAAPSSDLSPAPLSSASAPTGPVSGASAAAEAASNPASGPDRSVPPGSADGWIVPEDVPDRADSLSVVVEAAMSDHSTSELLERIEGELDRAGAELGAAFASARTAIADRASLMAIQDARQQVEAAAAGLPGWREELGEEARRLGELLARVDLARQLWTRTRGRAETEAAGETIRQRVDRSIQDIDRMTARTRDQRVRVLALDDRIVDHNTAIRDTLQKLEDATRAQADRLVTPSREPLWSRGLEVSLREELPQVPQRLAEFRQSTAVYFRTDARPFALQAVVALALVLLLRHLRDRMQQGSIAERMSPLAVRLLSRPYAMALLLAILPSPTLHPLAPRRVTQLLGMLALLPVARLLMAATQRKSLALYTGLLVLLIGDRAAIALAPLPTVTLLLFLAEILLGGWLAYAYRRRLRAEDGHPLLIHALSVGLYGLGVSLLAEVCGWSTLASLVGRLVLVAGMSGVMITAATLSIECLLSFALASPLMGRSRFVSANQEMVHRWGRVGLRLLGVTYWMRTVLNSLGLRAVAYESAQAVLDAGVAVGALSLSIGGVLAFVLTLAASMVVSRFVHEMLEDEVFPRTNLPRGLPHVLLTLTRYAIWSIGFLLALAAAGVQLSQLSILLGGLGVGIGLGLQDVVKNFAAGLTLLFERRVHVGDAVQIPDKGVFGRVLAIGMRASVVRNWNGTEVVMPNGDLVDGTVTNWTLSDATHRIEVPVVVASAADPEEVMALLRSVAASDPHLLRKPAPSALLKGFGSGSFEFMLGAWTDEEYEKTGLRTSELTLAVHRALKKAGIALPSGTQELRVVPWPAPASAPPPEAATPAPAATAPAPEPEPGTGTA